MGMEEVNEEIEKLREKLKSRNIRKTSSGKTDIEIKRVPCIIVDGVLYEQVAGGKFVFKKKVGGYEYVNHIDVDGVRLYPCKGEELSNGVVLLPTGPTPYKDVVVLLEEIQAFIHKWVDVPEDFEKICAWYVLLTYFYDLMYFIVYVSAIGDTGLGKSRLLDAVGRLCYRPMLSSGASTFAATKRLITKWKGTLIMDEGDIAFSDEKNVYIKMLNLGAEKHRNMFNCDKNNPTRLEFFNPYCPKLIARRKRYEDAALEARCITNIMYQTKRKISVQPSESFFVNQEILRNKLLKFRLDNYNKIKNGVSSFTMGSVLDGIEPRIRQASMPFFPLLDVIGGDAKKGFITFIRGYQKKLIEERSDTFDGMIVNALIELVELEKEFITSSDVSNWLINECGFKKCSPSTVGRHLSVLGLKPVLTRTSSKVKRVVPVTDKKFFDVAKRYCADEDKLKIVTGVTGVTDVSGYS